MQCAVPPVSDLSYPHSSRSLVSCASGLNAPDGVIRGLLAFRASGGVPDWNLHREGRQPRNTQAGTRYRLMNYSNFVHVSTAVFVFALLSPSVAAGVFYCVKLRSACWKLLDTPSPPFYAKFRIPSWLPRGGSYRHSYMMLNTTPSLPRAT